MREKNRKLDNVNSEKLKKQSCSTSDKVFECKKSCTSKNIYNFLLNNCTSLENFAKYLYRPADPACLGVVRALFGFCMVLDIVEERGFADVDLKWGDPNDCHFPLIHGMEPPSLQWMILLYWIMWTGAFGIMLGYKFRLSCVCFAVPYWYIFLLDKTFWNNHTYLYGIVAMLLLGTGANKYFAIDAMNNKSKEATVPFWNYFGLKFQFFLLYFMAGLKKSEKEWLDGFSMTNLSSHWVFAPFRVFLTVEQTDYLIVHWFGFVFDLTIGFWMLFDKTRIPAMVFCATFNLMNSRLFSIGMFPYVCLSTMPLFCRANWPRRVISLFKSLFYYREKPDNEQDILTRNNNSKQTKVINKRQLFVTCSLLLHVIVQLFMPYSHFITKGYNNWVPGLYGYSWDMMVHSWDTILVVVKVHDNDNNEDHFVDPQAWVQSDRWTKHGDMVIQYSSCLKRNLLRQKEEAISLGLRDNERWAKLSSNLSVYVDVWCSLNSRFQQRIFDPNVDMLTVDWHPLKPVSFLMPLLTHFSSYRYKLDEIQREVYSWSNYTDVLFVADYPNMALENFISQDFTNVSLSVLEGQVTYSEDLVDDVVTVSKGNSIKVATGKFHKIKTTSVEPASYMYTYTNRTEEENAQTKGFNSEKKVKPMLPIFKELNYKLKAWTRALSHIANCILYFVYQVPMVRRIRMD